MKYPYVGVVVPSSGKMSKKLGDSFTLSLGCNSKSLFKFPPPSLPQHLPLCFGDNSDVAHKVSSVRNSSCLNKSGTANTWRTLS